MSGYHRRPAFHRPGTPHRDIRPRYHPSYFTTPWWGHTPDVYVSSPTIISNDPDEERRQHATDRRQQREIRRLRYNQNAMQTAAMVTGIGVLGVLAIIGVAWAFSDGKQTQTPSSQTR